MQENQLLMLLDRSELIPKPSREISDIFKILNNPVELDIDLLVEKIQDVENLHDLMIKNLNTGYFKANREIKTIKEAIVYFGMQTIQNLITLFITIQLFSEARDLNKGEKPERVFYMNQYFKHVLGTSVASAMLSAMLNIGDRYKLFSYGLIHDIGIVVVDTCTPELLDQVTKKLKSGVHQVVAERLAFSGITHAEIGAWLCRKWNIRQDIVDIVEFHHTPFLAKETTDELKIIHIADVISTMYYEKLLGVNLHHGLSNKLMDSLGIKESHIKIIVEKLPEEVERLNYFSIYG